MDVVADLESGRNWEALEVRSDLIQVVKRSRSDSGTDCSMKSAERRRALSVMYQMRLQSRQSQELREVK